MDTVFVREARDQQILNSTLKCMQIVIDGKGYHMWAYCREHELKFVEENI